jgi:hypothetical protein
MTRANVKPQAAQDAEQAHTENPIFEDPPELPAAEGSLAVPAQPKGSVQVISRNRVVNIPSPTITRIKLIQGIGKFRDMVTDEEYDELELLPIALQAQRVWLREKYIQGQKPRCLSTNGSTAIMQYADGELPEYPGQVCVECPQFSRHMWAGKRGKCEPQNLIFGYHRESGKVMSLLLRHKTLPLEHFWNRHDIFARTLVTLFPVEEHTKYGAYFVTEMKAKSRLTEEQPQQALALVEATDFSNFGASEEDD